MDIEQVSISMVWTRREIMGDWEIIWQYVPISYEAELGKLEDITQKVIIPNNLNTEQIKIKFHNLYGVEKLEIEEVTVGKIKVGEKEISDIQKVTYKRSNQISLEVGETLWSDVINLSVTPEYDLIIACYFKKRFSVTSICCNWSRQTWYSKFEIGNHTNDSSFAGKNTKEVLTALSLDIYEPHGEAGIMAVSGKNIEDKVTEIAFFGDSITHMSYYTDPFMKLAREKSPGRVTFANCGIGGNRLIFDATFAPEIIGNGKCFGKKGISRFERDIYSDFQPDKVFIMEGINDCVHGYQFNNLGEVPTPLQLFDAIKELIEIGHRHGSEVYISTIMPFGVENEPFREPAEKIRCETNKIIRESKIADGIIDLDMLIRDPVNPDFMRNNTHLGDGVHPNEQGGKEIATELFKRLIESHNL